MGVVPMFKKGDWRLCSNLRRITFLNFPEKVYARILERRIYLLVEPWVQEEQCGFFLVIEHWTSSLLP